MKKAIGVFIFCLAPVNLVYAQSLLVTVELRDSTQIEKWLGMGYATFEFVNNTAIAEIDEADMPLLSAAGLMVQVIDYSPWGENYFLGNIPTDLESVIPGDVIWHKGDISLVKSPEDEIGNLYRFPIKLQPLRRSELPQRFWETMSKKCVPLRTIEWDPFIQSIVD